MKKILLMTLLIGVLLLGACGGTSTEPAPTSEGKTSPAITSSDIPGTSTSPPVTSTSPPVTSTSPPVTSTSPPVTSTSPVSTYEPTQTQEPEPVQASDDSVTIILDKIERVGVMPDDIIEALSVGRQYDPPTPAAGCDFFCIYLTITRIDNIHIISVFGYDDEETALFSAATQKYKRIVANLQGVIYHDPHNITSSYEVAEDATAFWVYEVPKDENPLRFEFIYSFKIDIEDETENRGQIDIIIE